MRNAAKATVDVSLPGSRHGTDVFGKLLAGIWKLLKQIAPGKPVSLLFEEGGTEVIHVVPGALGVHDLECDVLPHGDVDARVIEIARVDHHWFAPPLGLERTQRTH